MGYDSTTERLISLKKLAGKAQTSNLKGLSNEGLPSGVTISFETVFGESITKEPSDSALYTITGQVEYLRFPVEFIAGTATTDGRHGFELRLPDNYSNDSSNPNAGTYPYQTRSTRARTEPLGSTAQFRSLPTRSRSTRQMRAYIASTPGSFAR